MEQPPPLQKSRPLVNEAAPTGGSVAVVLHNIGVVVMVAFFAFGLVAIAVRATARRRQADQVRRFRSIKADV